MTDITVKEFSKTVGLPVNRLIDQLKLAGVTKKNENDLISDEEKMQLLNFVRNNQDAKKIDNENTNNTKADTESTDEILEPKKKKTVVRRKKVFSKKNNQITEKLESNKEENSVLDNKKLDTEENDSSQDENLDINIDNDDLSSETNVVDETPLIIQNQIKIIKKEKRNQRQSLLMMMRRQILL